MVKDIHVFARRLLFKVINDKPSTFDQYDFPSLEFSETKFQALDDLMSLWEEGHTVDDESPMLTLPGVVVPVVSFPPPMNQNLVHFMLHANPNI